MRGLVRRVTAKRGGGRVEEPLRERYAGDETGAEEYEGSLEVMRRDPVAAGSGARSRKILVMALAAAALLTAGAGMSYAHGEASPAPG